MERASPTEVKEIIFICEVRFYGKSVICKADFFPAAGVSTRATAIDGNSCKYIRLACKKQKSPWDSFSLGIPGALTVLARID